MMTALKRIAAATGHIEKIPRPGAGTQNHPILRHLAQNRKGSRDARLRQSGKVAADDRNAPLRTRFRRSPAEGEHPLRIPSGRRDGKQRPARDATHRGNVAQVAFHEFGPRDSGRSRGRIEMDMSDQLVHSGKQIVFPGDLQRGTIVSRTERDAGKRGKRRQQRLQDIPFLQHDDSIYPRRDAISTPGSSESSGFTRFPPPLVL